MYIMGTLLRHGSDEQKQRYLPRIAARRAAAAGLRRHRARRRLRDDAHLDLRERRGDSYVINGQKVFISRAEHSDLLLLLARTTPYEELRTRRAACRVFLVDLREAVEAGQIVSGRSR